MINNLKVFKRYYHKRGLRDIFKFLAENKKVNVIVTTAGGIGTAEINNHRISMIVPVIFLSTIFSIGFLGALTDSYFKKYRIKGRHIVIGVSAFI